MSAEKIAIPEDEAERRRRQREKNQAMVEMVDEWLASESNEDANVFDELKAILEAGHTPPRKLFHDE